RATSHFAQKAEIRSRGNAGHSRRAAAAEVAAGQWGTGGGTDSDILPGQFASDAAGTGTGHGKNQLCAGNRSHGEGRAASHAVDVGAAAARARQPCDQHIRGDAASVEDEARGRLEDNSARADVTAGVFGVSRSG